MFPVGCAGVITHAEPLADGRYNIVLRGIEKFRIEDEDGSRPYRLARVDALPEQASEPERAALRHERRRLEAILVTAIERGGGDPKFPPAIPDEDLVNALAQYLELQPIERQALLECDGVVARCRALTDLLEMKTYAPKGAWTGGAVH